MTKTLHYTLFLTNAFLDFPVTMHEHKMQMSQMLFVCRFNLAILVKCFTYSINISVVFLLFVPN